MLIENPCNISKENLRIKISEFDYDSKEKNNLYINPNEVDNLVLTRPSSISTAIFKLNPDINIMIFNNGKPTNIIMPYEKVSKIISNNKLLENLSRSKRRRLAFVFCKAVCSNRIKVLSRINERRKNPLLNEKLKAMRILDKKLKQMQGQLELMGIEGNIAKLFYEGLAILNPAFNQVRNREAKDLANVLMNLTHTVLRNRILMLLIGNCLNPSFGFLHGKADREQNYLCFDFSEMWIAYVDKLVFYAIEKGIVTSKDINEEGRLNQQAVRKIIELLNKRITNDNIEKTIIAFIKYLEGKNRFGWKAVDYKS